MRTLNSGLRSRGIWGSGRTSVLAPVKTRSRPGRWQVRSRNSRVGRGVPFTKHARLRRPAACIGLWVRGATFGSDAERALGSWPGGALTGGSGHVPRLAISTWDFWPEAWSAADRLASRASGSRPSIRPLSIWRLCGRFSELLFENLKRIVGSSSVEIVSQRRFCRARLRDLPRQLRSRSVGPIRRTCSVDQDTRRCASVIMLCAPCDSSAVRFSSDDHRVGEHVGVRRFCIAVRRGELAVTRRPTTWSCRDEGRNTWPVDSDWYIDGL